ncbi:hypothetical protein RhiirA4_473944 [Rhizophagus irregularis]|uniref:Uncharacterized protein n=1 Tax=Rhizophagus irregularis TaxID=588596 RepID=A0A2I1H7N3_9GLOM|nr:hypothetical protein RhiirA4_473944 [Rhizophagus irregularis]
MKISILYHWTNTSSTAFIPHNSVHLTLHGTEKTVLTRIASRGWTRSHIPPNAPYVKNFDEKFGKAFGKALNFKFEENIFFSTQLVKKIFNKGSEDPKWMRALEAFKRASAIREFLDDAKKSAAVKVRCLEEWSATRSAWSRAKAVIEIGDLSEKESMKYLTEKRKINEVDTKRYMNWLVDAL